MADFPNANFLTFFLMNDLRHTELPPSEYMPSMPTVVFPELIILEYKICFIFFK